MITYWQQEDGQFFKTKKDEINTKKPLWIDARNVTRDETNQLQEDYDIEQDHILDILDPDELSRMEDGEGYILTSSRAELSLQSVGPTAKSLRTLATTESKISSLLIFLRSSFRL